MNKQLLSRALNEGALIIKTQNHLLYSKAKDKFEGVYLSSLSKLNTKDWEHVCTMKEFYEAKRDEASAAYLAACNVEDEEAKAKWLIEFNNYEKAVKRCDSK